MRGSCLLLTPYSSYLGPHICFCDSQTVPKVFPNIMSVNNCASVRQQEGVCIFNCGFMLVYVCLYVCVMEGERECLLEALIPCSAG